MGIGAIVHTLNPRLFLADLEYIINHAQDKVLLLDLTFVELIKKLQPKLKSVKAFVVLTDISHMPKQGLEVQAAALLTCFDISEIISVTTDALAEDNQCTGHALSSIF